MRMETSEYARKNIKSYNASIDLIPMEYSDETSYDRVAYVRFAELQKIAEFGDMPGGLELFFTYAFYIADELFKTGHEGCSKNRIVPYKQRLGLLIESYSQLYQCLDLDAIPTLTASNMHTPCNGTIETHTTQVAFEETTESRQQTATVVKKILRRDKPVSISADKGRQSISPVINAHESPPQLNDLLHTHMHNEESDMTLPTPPLQGFPNTENVHAYKDGGSYHPFSNSMSRPFSPIKIPTHVRTQGSNLCIELRGVSTVQRSMIMDYIMNTITGGFAELSVRELR